MEIGTAVLCDAATIREGLMHILGGGVARIHRESFPAPMGVTLALLLLLHRTEQGKPHEIEIIVQDADGKRLAEIHGALEAKVGEDAEPTEMAAAPMALPLNRVAIEHPGMYSIEILIDNQHKRTIAFRALLKDQLALPAGGSG